MSINYLTLIVLGVLFLGSMATAGVVALGFYLGWFRNRPESAGGNGEVALFEDEFRTDRKPARTKAQEFEYHMTEPSTVLTENGKESAVMPAKYLQN